MPATGDAIVTFALYVPALKDPVVACSVMVDGAVVELSVLLSHPVPEA